MKRKTLWEKDWLTEGHLQEDDERLTTADACWIALITIIPTMIVGFPIVVLVLKMVDYIIKYIGGVLL